MESGFGADRPNASTAIACMIEIVPGLAWIVGGKFVRGNSPLQIKRIMSALQTGMYAVR